jgi:hypothetical protein
MYIYVNMEFVPVCFRVNVAQSVITISWSDIPGALFDDFMSDEFVLSTISSRLLPLDHQYKIYGTHSRHNSLSTWTNTFHPNSSDQNHIYHGSTIKLGRCSKRKPDYRFCTDDPVWYIHVYIIVDNSLVKSSWSLSQFSFE